MIRGITAKYLFNEAEWSTVVEDLPKYEARFWDRVVVVAFGLGVIIFGFWLFPKSGVPPGNWARGVQPDL